MTCRASGHTFSSGKHVWACVIAGGIGLFFLLPERRIEGSSVPEVVQVVRGGASTLPIASRVDMVGYRQSSRQPATINASVGSSPFAIVEARHAFDREPRDDGWARPQEAQLTAELQRLSATVVGFRHATVRCASTQCEVSAQTIDLHPPPAGSRLMTPGDWTDEIRTGGMAMDAMFVMGEPAQGQDVTLYLKRS